MESSKSCAKIVVMFGIIVLAFACASSYILQLIPVL